MIEEENLSIDALCQQRQKEQLSQISQNSENEHPSTFEQEETEIDQKMIQIIENTLDIPYQPTPFLFIIEKFLIKPIDNITPFPRLSKFNYQALKLFPKKLVFSQTLVFTIIQEMILHPSLSDELGQILIQYCHRTNINFQVDFNIWCNFVCEIGLCYPNLLVYVLAIARQKFFQQEFTDDYSNEQVIVFLLTSLLCPCVISNENCFYIVKSLKEYLGTPISPYAMDVFLGSLKFINPSLFLSFPSYLPPMKAATDQILKQISYALITYFLEIEQTTDLTQLIHELPKLQQFLVPNDDELVMKAHIVITYLEKLCFVSYKLNEISIEQLTEIQHSLFIQKPIPITELPFLKEKIHFARNQIGRLIQLIKSKKEE